jgi:hypothetical protein
MVSNKLGNIKIWKSTTKSILMREDLWDLVEDVLTPIGSSLGEKSKAKTIADTMLVLNRWESLRMEEQMDIAAFFTKIYKIKKELQLAGHEQTTGVIVHQILS